MLAKSPLFSYKLDTISIQPGVGEKWRGGGGGGEPPSKFCISDVGVRVEREQSYVASIHAFHFRSSMRVDF